MLIALSIISILVLGPAVSACADNYDVDSGKQDSTYKNKDGKKPPDDSSKNKPRKDNDSHDRSENDAGHSRNTDQSTGSSGDVLIDQSTYKNRPQTK